MIASEQTRPVEVSAYDGVVIFSGLGPEPVVLAPEVAERIGRHLCAAGDAAAHDLVRTWREDVFGLPSPRPDAPSGRRSIAEPRSFQPRDAY